MQLPRSSGVLLHPTSLPGGRLGPEARELVAWLARAGQSWWQMLPLGPPDRHRSPYRAASAFATWPGLLERPRAPVSRAQVEDFRERHAFWAGDWERFAGDGALADQVRFEREWGELRALAAAHGVGLVGDLPIYVAEGSADHRLHPELFRDGAVAGAPPDGFSATGQHWGNPLYDWPANRRRGYRWWIERLRRALELFDVVRIDHFRGFVAYWAIPERAGTRADLGRWRRGPGRAPFDAAARALGELPVIAENLGVITEPVERLRRTLGFPGMVVTMFGFAAEPGAAPHRVAAHEPDTVAYTGTHDHDTAAGWWASAPESHRRAALRELAERGIDEHDPAWALIRLTMSSRARVAVAQAQDVLSLGSGARMNVPGREAGNWRWRLAPGQLTPAHADRLRAATQEAGRAGG